MNFWNTMGMLIGIIDDHSSKRTTLSDDLGAANKEIEDLKDTVAELEDLLSRPTWVCHTCGKVGITGFTTITHETMDGVDYDIECSNCQSTDIGENSASEITNKLDTLTADFEEQEMAFKELETYNKRLLYCLTQIYQDLPQKRDWLDPTLEKEIKSCIKKT